MTTEGIRSTATWRSLAAAYLAVQAALGVIWWGLLAASPTVRSWFELLPRRHGALDSFLLADLAVFIGGSAASALALWTASRWAVTATSFTAGGLVYATLCLAEQFGEAYRHYQRQIRCWVPSWPPYRRPAGTDAAV